MTKIIDGKKISKEIKDEIKQQVAEMKKARNKGISGNKIRRYRLV